MHDNEQAIALYEKLGFERVPSSRSSARTRSTRSCSPAPPRPRRSTPTPASSSTRRAAAASAWRSSTPRAASSAWPMAGAHPLPREPDRADLGRHVDLRRQGGDAPPRRAGRALGAGADGRPATPARSSASSPSTARVVVKPARGEQGAASRSGVETPEAVAAAVENARRICDRVLVEAFSSRRGPAARRHRLRAGGGGDPPAGPGRRRRPQHGARADRAPEPPPRRRHGRRIADPARRRDRALHRPPPAQP
jgi:hypothetical protein